MVTDEDIIEKCRVENSMNRVSIILGISFSTLKRRAIKLGCYLPNQGGKDSVKSKFSLSDLLKVGSNIKSKDLKERLIKEKLKIYKCEECSINEWNGKKIVLELDHIDGNKNNNLLENLRILCPNCHSQTPTFRGRKVN